MLEQLKIIRGKELSSRKIWSFPATADSLHMGPITQWQLSFLALPNEMKSDLQNIYLRSWTMSMQ